MELNSISLLLPTPKNEEWTLCPWTIWHKRLGGSVPLIRGLGSISVEPIGFVMMNIKVPCVQGYNEDQIAIVMDDPGMTEWPVSWVPPLFIALWR